MLYERDVVDAIPSHGFIHDYVVHAIKQTTSPLAYHLGTGLSLLATTCPLDYGMNYAGTLRANLFVMLVGRSGEDQKSTAMGIGRDLLFEAAAPLIGDFPGSPEGLIDSLSRCPSQLIPISEMGRFLASAQRGYFEPIKALMADLWDAHSIQRTRANNRVTRVDSPRLSIVAACSIPYLEKYTLAEDWTGGFMGRWCVMFGKRERTNADPAGDRSDFERLSGELRRMATVSNAGWCTGLTPAAKKLWHDWFHEISNRHMPSQIMGVRSRAPTMARKAALLYAWDWGKPASGAPWQMDLPELHYGIKFAELHIKSVIGLSGRIAEHPDARLRRSVLEAIEVNKNRATLGQILRVLRMRRRPVAESLDALVEEKVVRRVPIDGEYFYVAQEGV
ncbi:DUF3987 domain-containing protein [bacterium]|nr:DUF3987 domain-containing protein [bacterium]